ncbi:MAG: hypothetical protein ACJ0A3_04040 [Dehalococcoidia bacterium]
MSENYIDPNLDQARQTALLAHKILVKFQEMQLPEKYWEELAKLSTDISDMISAKESILLNLNTLVNTNPNWETIGEILVDIHSHIEHIMWHSESIQTPIKELTSFAFEQPKESS